MLSDDQLNLLTAAVDGELPAFEQLRLERLLARSAEARALLQRLQADSARMKQPPLLVPPVNFATRVLARLPGNQPRVLKFPARGYRRYVPLAAAACLLLGIAASSFWFFQQPDPGHAGVAKKGPTRALPNPKLTDVLPPNNEHVSSRPGPDATADAIPAPREVTAVAIELIPEPRAVDRDLIGSPLLPVVPALDLVEIRIPFLVAAADFDRDDVRQKLLDEFGRDAAFRIDLFVKDPVRAAEVFQAAAKSEKVTVHTDATTNAFLKKKMPASTVVYAECFTAAELHELLTRMAATDAKSPNPVFETFHVTPAVTADARELRDLLGIDPVLWKRQPGPAPADPKPINSGTGDQVAKALTTPANKAGEKHAVMLTYTPAARTPPMASKELKSYIEKRGERKPNAVPVMIVIRN